MPTRLIQSPSDLVTSHRAVCDGFLAQAITKTERATRYVEEARKLHDVLMRYDHVTSLADAAEIFDNLIAASGFSDKARARLSGDELRSALTTILKLIEKKAGKDWREELVYRFLLTRGDSLGGMMRNLTGALAGRKLTGAVLAALKAKRIEPEIVNSVRSPDKVVRVVWPGRLLLFDKTPGLLGNNIDVILLTTDNGKRAEKDRLSHPEDYVACGELKGGIDPAGADEHWKTAASALERVRKKFKKITPALFFVGSAIEESMAREIFDQLRDGRLTYAANLTVPDQVRDLARWLVTL